jgi:hypothetical protein
MDGRVEGLRLAAFGDHGGEPRVPARGDQLRQHRELPELVRRLDAAGVEAEDVSIRRPTLDEVFLAETATETETVK